MSLDLTKLLSKENRRFERCTIQQQGASLYLQATLPEKSLPTKSRQQRIALKLKAEPFNISKAAEIAQRLEDVLEEEAFSWANWTPSAIKQLHAHNSHHVLTGEAFVAAIERTFKEKYPETPQNSTTTWGKKWSPTIRRLKHEAFEAITENDIREHLLSIKSPSARATAGSVISVTVKARGWSELIPTESIYQAASGYTKAELTPRDIPDDEELLSYVEKIPDKNWRWMYSICLAYGIRPHEIAHSTIKDDRSLWVDYGKTGAREVWACPDELVDELNLLDVYKPRQSAATVAKAAADYLSHTKKSGRIGVVDRPARIPFGLYTLRHAYAIRMLR
ncbi:MAG: hypothetical protein GY914_01680, partial [Prochlorococcus sp.]|nr:hypothetical protein [Prochlorococcus sp.]